MSELSPSIISDSPKPVCVVCDDKSEGQHFGQFSCKACAAFFRRAVSSKKHYECKINKNCNISKDIRNLCRCCRYQKCLAKGMLPSSVQGHRDSYGKRSLYSESPISTALTENPNKEMKIVPQMFNGYVKFQSSRKDSCASLIGEKNFTSWNPEVTTLAYDMVMEYFLPFADFEPEDKKTLFEKFAVLFDNAEKSYSTFKAYGQIQNNDRVVLADGGYIKLDETYKFFANSTDANVDPQQLARIFLQCFTNIAKAVVPVMAKAGIDDFSMAAIYGLCLFKEDVVDISTKTREIISTIKNEIFRDLHIYYRNKGLNDIEITIKICKIMLLIPTLEHVGRLFHENFFLVDLFSMLDVPIAYKN